WLYPSAQGLRNAERLAQLDMRLPRILKGEDRPADAAERVQLGWLCQQPYKQLNAAAARLYSEAFAADPKLADDVSTNRRYNAACAAALASNGQGKDADKLDEKERAHLRQQTLTWLRADLAAWQKILDKERVKPRPIVQQTMRHWQQDTDFAGIRCDALAKLPETERQAWRKVWQE